MAKVQAPDSLAVTSRTSPPGKVMVILALADAVPVRAMLLLALARTSASSAILILSSVAKGAIVGVAGLAVATVTVKTLEAAPRLPALSVARAVSACNPSARLPVAKVQAPVGES